MFRPQLSPRRHAGGSQLRDDQLAMTDNLCQLRNGNSTYDFLGSKRPFPSRTPDIDAFRIENQNPTFETIKRFAILPEQFSQAAEELTPTMKIRRRVIEKKYAKLIESLYSGLRDGRL